MIQVQVPSFGRFPPGSGWLSAGLCLPLLPVSACVCVPGEKLLEGVEITRDTVKTNCLLQVEMFCGDTGNPSGQGALGVPWCGDGGVKWHLSPRLLTPGVGGSLQPGPHPHPAQDPLPGRQGGWAGRLSWVTLRLACECHRPPAPTVVAGHWAKCQTTKRERRGCLGWGCRCGCAHGQMDGQTAVPAVTAPGHEQASHGFVFLLWLWALFSSSPPFSLSLGAFQCGRRKRLAACSGELLCLQASSAQ